MKYFTVLSTLLIIQLIFGCEQHPDNVAMETTDGERFVPESKENIPESAERKLVKKGQVEFQTDDLNSTR